ncbi:hypothetical protein RFI_04337 [Reticulomyxa filosa]|uniref:Uncharacterized protein n=1 Tax=Reticulomyxa filosa TaxID=46433 RepID=X6P3J9_RETFI|nr:hypothetical protein RFI_04337 [Reticulomyxa filosa]|eukprot:ETO32781.1 hypothetical protein RFI_04337 [Reticulomyxa filosa]
MNVKITNGVSVMVTQENARGDSNAGVNGSQRYEYDKHITVHRSSNGSGGSLSTANDAFTKLYGLRNMNSNNSNGIISNSNNGNSNSNTNIQSHINNFDFTKSELDNANLVSKTRDVEKGELERDKANERDSSDRHDFALKTLQNKINAITTESLTTALTAAKKASHHTTSSVYHDIPLDLRYVRPTDRVVLYSPVTHSYGWSVTLKIFFFFFLRLLVQDMLFLN